VAKRGNGLQFAILEWKSNSQFPSIWDTFFVHIFMCKYCYTDVLIELIYLIGCTINLADIHLQKQGLLFCADAAIYKIACSFSCRLLILNFQSQFN
jgi:hypothetical protein